MRGIHRPASTHTPDDAPCTAGDRAPEFGIDLTKLPIGGYDRDYDRPDGVNRVWLADPPDDGLEARRINRHWRGIAWSSSCCSLYHRSSPCPPKQEHSPQPRSIVAQQ